MNFGTVQVTNIFVGALNAIEAYFGTEKVWESTPPTRDWLCFTAEDVGATIAFNKVGNPDTASIVTSTDGQTWTPYTFNTTITLANVGDKVYFRAADENDISFYKGQWDNYKFATTEGKRIAASGNIQTLMKADGSRLDISGKTNCYCDMFNGCSSLTTAPELPATTLANNCYEYMFKGCTSLTSAPSLPATTLAQSCYHEMFNGCSFLTTAPALPATTLADECYAGMFYNCQRLTSAPSLPATTLAYKCYQGMFIDCTSLTSAPALPATTLAQECYEYMFQRCSNLTTTPVMAPTIVDLYSCCRMFEDCVSLTTAPALPATTLVRGCYDNMFLNCYHLTTAPELPATTLADYCYYNMFKGCSLLNTITLGYIGNFASAPTGAFSDWVDGVAASGTFYYDGSDTTTGTSAIPSGWTVLPIPTPRSELCFTAEEANSTVSMSANGSAPSVSLEYSTDGDTWDPFVVGTTTVTLANIGDKMYMRATSAGNTGMGTSSSNYNQFVMTGKIAASGNVDTLLDQNGNATLTSNCYNHLFDGCTSLTSAPTLPSTTIADRCYMNMFSGCTSLTQAPALPATALADYCYNAMFDNCTSLRTAPELSATTVATGCCRYMFQGCSSLTTAPTVLPAITLVGQCYYYMFKGCTSLTSAPSLPATTLAGNCYRSMFNGCESLTTAPELPATTLVNNCYREMFSGCTNLNTITLGYTGNFGDASSSPFLGWVWGVAASGTFYYNGSDTTTGTSAIPSGWTVTPYTP